MVFLHAMWLGNSDHAFILRKMRRPSRYFRGHTPPTNFRRVVSGAENEGGLIRRFGRLFGLDPRIAFAALIVDMMLNAGDIVSMGMLLPLSLAAGVVLSYVTYRAQINWYGDDPESAKIKPVILGLLTAIPTPSPSSFIFLRA